MRTTALLLALVALGLGADTSSAGRRADGRVVITGRVVAEDGTTPANFAEITVDCKRPVCTAGADGTFDCNTRAPESGSFCFEHPRFGRKRIELDTRSATADLGTVQLLTGTTVRVVKPIHVVLPEATTVALLRKGTRIGEPRLIGSHSELEFAGVPAGKYDLLLAGPEPLQRKLFPIETGPLGEVEVILSIEPYRLTCELEYRRKPLGGATVELDGYAWHAEMETNQSGELEVELWDAGAYAVAVSAPDLAQPYMLMKRASPAESLWRLRVPSRRIRGRVFDAETGKAVRGVALQVASDTGETRANRTIPVDREDGTFVYSGAADGRYVISATAEGYLPAAPEELHLREADGDVRLDLPLVRGIQVRVTVVDANLKPVGGAAVLADFVSSGSLARLQRTDAGGVVSITLPRGHEAKQVYFVSKNASLATATVTARDAENGVQVVLAPVVSTLTIATESDDGEPLQGIGVSLRQNGREWPRAVIQTLARERGQATVTDAAGRLAIAGLPPGDYEIGWTPRGLTRPVGWSRVTVGAGETRVTQTFRKEHASLY